jgi:hypothetical protein
VIGRIVLFGLASSRLVRALLHETIGAPYQDRVAELADPACAVRDGVLDIKRFGRREAYHRFLTCEHCLGFWLTAGLVIGWRSRLLRPFIEALAAATIVSIAAEHYPNFNWEND